MLKETGVNVVRETMMRSYSPTQCIIVTLLHRVSSYPHKKQRNIFLSVAFDNKRLG